MNRVDVHPEDLLDAAHAGLLTPADRARLQQHIAHCAACATEVALIDDFEAELSPAAGDELLLERMVAFAVDKTPSAAAPNAVVSASRRMLYAVAAVSLVIGAFGGAAAAMVAMRAAFEEDAAVVLPADEGPTGQGVDAPEVSALPAPAPREVETPEVLIAPAEDSPVEDSPVEDSPVEGSPAEETPRETHASEQTTDQAAATPRPAPRPTPRGPTAAELLAEANSARRERRYPAAVATYRRLQRQYPQSRESALSRVTLGRLLLDGMSDPSGALTEFDRYLATSRHRVLDEEARVGRALALQRLGRRDAERQAWRDLLEHHPDTLHAERARARL